VLLVALDSGRHRLVDLRIDDAFHAHRRAATCLGGLPALGESRTQPPRRSTPIVPAGSRERARWLGQPGPRVRSQFRTRSACSTTWIPLSDGTRLSDAHLARVDALERSA
jgi:hypothetical protein